MRLYLDLETSSSVDLKKVGTDVYAHHPDTKVLMLAYAFDDGPVSLWLPGSEDMPVQLGTALNDPKVTKIAWNASFEMSILSAVLHIPIRIEEWFDPMAYARYLGYPGSLDEAGDALGLDVAYLKNPEGKKLIKMFCSPTKGTKKVPSHFKTPESHPEEWEKFKGYCVQDVIAERANLHCLETKAPFPESEQKIWILDQTINQRGIPIDLNFAAKALAVAESARAIILDKIKNLTGVVNPNAPQQLKAWFETQGFNYESLDKSHVEEELSRTDLPELVRQVLELKQELGGIAFKKLPVIQKRTRNDRLCEAFTYHSAHTGRWASRGVQFHNLLRPTKQVSENNDAIVKAILEGLDIPNGINPIEAVGGTLRAAVFAPEGSRLFVADYSSIENRVLGWLAKCPGILNVFKQGLDPYKDFAVKFFNVAYDAVTKEQRQFCKPPVLGCGFGMGWRRLIHSSKGYGVILAEDDSKNLVYSWREEYSEVVDYWKTIGTTVVRAVTLKEQYQLGPLRIDGRDPKMLHIILPSERALHYDSPTIGLDMYNNRVLKYMGVNDKVGWGEIEARGSAIVENVVQAIARDILVNGMMNATEAGFEIVLHVHDEAVAEAKYSSPLTYEQFEECLVSRPKWGKDIPLAVEGYEGVRYKKG